MYNNIYQLYTFIAVVFYGIVCGVVYEPFTYIKRKINNAVLRAVIDVPLFIIFAIGYVCLAYTLNFDNFRVYMVLGIAFGYYIWHKSFHYYLQSFAERYIINKKTKRGDKYGRRKETENF